MSEVGAVLLSVKGLCKSFPAVRALHNVDLSIHGGSVHALVGENGAGKSTLARIIAGTLDAGSGEMTLADGAYRPGGRADAQRHGIRMVMQELNLFSNLTVAENIFLEDLPRRWGVINYRRLHKRAREVMGKIGLNSVSVDEPVGNLSVGMQQMVEIAAGLSQDCRILILDEPTASLTDRETGLLFEQIDRLRASGVAVLYISHRMEEIKQIADTVTILRDGELVSTDGIDRLSIPEIVNRMVGRDLSGESLSHTPETGPAALRVADLHAGSKVRGVSFDVHKCEILGFAGLMGSGRTETMRAIFGADPVSSGEIYLHASTKPTRIRSPRQAVANGIALIPEDRKEQGLFLPLGVDRNILLPSLSSLFAAGVIPTAKERRIALQNIESLNVKCSGPEQTVETLSGGNQQKVVIAKWLVRDCDILIFDEPTRGIDVGAKFEIYHMLSDLAARGKAIIMVSSDLKELTAVCDRIVVVSAGRIAGEFVRGEYSEEKINAAAFSNYMKGAG
jgi:ribose transport system ATP-binding protein